MLTPASRYSFCRLSANSRYDSFATTVVRNADPGTVHLSD